MDSFPETVALLLIVLFLSTLNILECIGHDDHDHHDHDHDHNHDDESYYEDDKYDGYLDPITLGSLMKLQHVNSQFLLHSHDINYGSGSGQQSVTGFEHMGDDNSLWQIFPSHVNTSWTHAAPILCDNIIRLRHVSTKKWLHSHSAHRAPVSGKQEVTCYGDENNSDTGDNWQVKCSKGSDKYWRRGETFALRHIDTGYYLFASKKANFNQQNCRNCPIIGQLEISCTDKKAKGAKWMSHHGFYFRPFDYDDDPTKYDKDENDQTDTDANKKQEL